MFRVEGTACARFTEAWSEGSGGEEGRAARGFGWPYHSRRGEHHHGQAC